MTVWVPTLLRELTGGAASVEGCGPTVRALIADLDARYPGFAERLCDGGALRSNVSVAVDGEVSPLGILEDVSTASEVHFVLAISGG